MFLSLLSPSGTTGVFQRTLRGIVVASTATLVADKFASLDTTLASLSAQAAARLTSFADGGNQTLDAAVLLSQAQLSSNASTTSVLALCQAASNATLRSFADGGDQTLGTLTSAAVAQTGPPPDTPESRTFYVFLSFPERTSVQPFFNFRVSSSLNYTTRTFYPYSYSNRIFTQISYSNRTGIPHGS